MALHARLLLIGLYASGCSPTAQAVTPAPTEITLHDYHGYGAVDVEVAGQQVPFFFDTGGGITIITPALAADLHRKPWGRLTGYRMRGDRLDLPKCDPFALGFGSLQVVPSAVAVFDLGAFMPKDWTVLPGILTLQSLDPHAITIDLAHRHLTVENDESLKGRIAKMTPLEVRFERSSGGLTLVAFLAAKTPSGRAIWLEFDSGSDSTLVLAPHAAAMLGIDLEAPTVEKKIDKSGRVDRWIVPELEIQLAGLAPIKTRAVVEDLIFDGNFGRELIKNWVFTLDLKEGRAWATPANR